MSLIEQIKVRSPSDIQNEGLKLSLTGTLSSGTDQAIYTIATTQYLIITGYNISSSSGSAVTVQLSLKKGSNTLEFFKGHVGNGGTISRDLDISSLLYGDLGYSLVATCDGSFSYTIDARVCRGLTPLNYIQQIGSQEHSNPYFGPESGKDRGQSEF